MARLITWKIYTTEGRYLGQQSAFTPTTALAQYISLSGTVLAEDELEAVPVSDGRQRVTYGSDAYDVVPEDGGQVDSWS